MSHNKESERARKEIRYLNKNFEQFRKSMVDFAKVYFPNTFNDFNESDPGMMFVEMASYVGDVLSYYIDSQLKESILTTAEERENIVQLAQAMGYMPRATVGAVVDLDVYQLLPATGTGASTQPDWRYSQLINEGMTVQTNDGSGQTFRTLDDIDFAASSSYDPTDLTVYSVDNDGIPVYYLLKKKVKARSGTKREIEFDFGDPEKFASVLIPETDIVSIDKITDSDGNIWHEVDFLAQDTIFEKVRNIPSNGSTSLSTFANTVPFLLKTIRVPRRFIKRLNSKNQYEIRFGAGVSSSPGATITPGPSNVGAGTGVSSLLQAWDPSNFLLSDAYGQVPQNTTLTIEYSTGGGVQSNVNSNTLTDVGNLTFARQMNNLDGDLVNQVRKSIACNNPSPATGGTGEEPTETIRQNTFAHFRAQNRTVTKEDYELRCYTMPAHLGTIAKAYAAIDDLGVTSCETDEQLMEEIKSLQSDLQECEDSKEVLENQIVDLQKIIDEQYTEIVSLLDNPPADCPPCEATQEDVDNAYDNGYSEGYTAGQGDCANSGGGGDTSTGSNCEDILAKVKAMDEEIENIERRGWFASKQEADQFEELKARRDATYDEYKKCKDAEKYGSDIAKKYEEEVREYQETIKRLEEENFKWKAAAASWEEAAKETMDGYIPADVTDPDGIYKPDTFSDEINDYVNPQDIKSFTEEEIKNIQDYRDSDGIQRNPGA